MVTFPDSKMHVEHQVCLRLLQTCDRWGGEVVRTNRGISWWLQRMTLMFV